MRMEDVDDRCFSKSQSIRVVDESALSESQPGY